MENSWGTVKGIQGFGNLERGNGSSGERSILAAATYPEVKKADERKEAFQKFECIRQAAKLPMLNRYLPV